VRCLSRPWEPARYDRRSTANEGLVRRGRSSSPGSITAKLMTRQGGQQTPAWKACPFQSMWTEANGLPIHAVVSASPATSDAKVLVLVHGLGLSHRYMMPVAAELARDYKVYVPDLPGFGDSGHPPRTLTIPELADGLASWMRAVGLSRVPLLGNSQGCQVIANLAVRHPDRVERAVLQGPTSPPEERSWFRQFIRWRQNAPYNPPSLDPVTWGEYRRSGYLRALLTFHYSLKDHIEDHLPHINVPVLVVRGECDPICRADWAERLTQLLPRGRLVQIPKVAHTLVYTAPVELAAVTRSFLARDLAALSTRQSLIRSSFAQWRSRFANDDQPCTASGLTTCLAILVSFSSVLFSCSRMSCNVFWSSSKPRYLAHVASVP
jgi:2-hydroxy-6-oxonona-2,4-dienedioate hydrolase